MEKLEAHAGAMLNLPTNKTAPELRGNITDEISEERNDLMPQNSAVLMYIISTL